MKCWLINEKLTPCGKEQLSSGGAQYAAVLSTEEWRSERDHFGMVIDMESELFDRRETKAIVGLDSLTGSFLIPDRQDISGKEHAFSFALDEKGIVIIDDEGYAEKLVEDIGRTKKWRLPSLERFIYDLLESTISQDLYLLNSVEKRLDAAEKQILAGEYEEFPAELNDIRGDLLDLRLHYEQLLDLGQELEENENEFFKEENLRYFRLFTDRVSRMKDSVTGLRDYVAQLRELVQSQLTVKQNKIMTILTVVTSIFLPLTLIAGWYGMNFKYMPEFDKPYAYPIVIGVCAAIVVGCLIWFKKKKWM
ncbi:MAG: magnesium transporter CorA [Clostridia bacterium]|nr:magnesium transporter CorA [Clostridia bacterium]